MKKLAIAAAALLTLAACSKSSTSSTTAGGTDSDSAATADSTQVAEAAPSEPEAPIMSSDEAFSRTHAIWAGIPDMMNITEQTSQVLSKALYAEVERVNGLIAADPDGGFSYEDALYWYSTQDPDGNEAILEVRLVETTPGYAQVGVVYGTPERFLNHTIKYVYEDGAWVIDDFDRMAAELKAMQ